MTHYRWREGGPKPELEAQVFGEEVERIGARLGLEHNHVKAEHIVAAAKKRGSPLKALFPFDDVAGSAQAHWEHLARQYLGGLQIVVATVTEGRATSSKGFYSVPVGKGQRGYVARDKIMDDRDLKALVIADAKRDLETYLSRYSGVLQMGTFVPQLQTVVDQMADEIDQLATSATRRSPPSPGKETPEERVSA